MKRNWVVVCVTQRADPAMVVEFFGRNFADDPLVLGPADARAVPSTLAALRVIGGAAYDGLMPTYGRCGVTFDRLG